jgi:hypothetical protein
VKAADARGPGALGERCQQRDADAPALPAVDDSDRHLGGVELVETDVAGDSDRGARWRRERDQRLVMPVVDGQEAAHVASGQLRLGREEPLQARALTQVSERERDHPPIGRFELPDRDRRHLRSHT